MRRLSLLLLTSLALGGAFALGGSDTFARAALWAGAPQLAERLAASPMLRGLSLYQRGRYNDAEEAFRQAGAPAAFNRGAALARAGRYRESIAVYRAVILRDPGDEQARFNLDVVLALYEAPVGSPLPGDKVGGDGSAPVGSTPSLTQVAGGGRGESGGNVVARADRQTALSRRHVRRGHDGRRIVANERWLATLQDQPGLYLKANIAAEHARRVERGLAMPPAEAPR
ncbi:MAG: hypothetical protein KTR21_03835 [Rhodobacteraceae bacterium]|nr:hypothetical protein [Paracoccaceae bacterium]